MLSLRAWLRADCPLCGRPPPAFLMCPALRSPSCLTPVLDAWLSCSADSEHASLSDDDDLCDPVLMAVGGLAGSAAAELAAAGCVDPLELMPTADLLNFAF